MRSYPEVAITPLTRAACATFPFFSEGRLRVAVIVKATFRFVPDDSMTLTTPEAILRSDVPWLGEPRAGLVRASDLVPYRPRADVLLRGSARALGGRATTRVDVRLAVLRGARIALDKRLCAVASVDPASGHEVAFTAMPLVWELALGSAQNPVGVTPSSGRRPNLLDPMLRPAHGAFGPVARSWPTRRALVRDPAAADGPTPSLPAAFDWSYYQAAPPDQRLDFLDGDEWVALEGFSAEHARLQSRLPGARAEARVYGPRSPAGKVIVVHADTLSIDADSATATVVWRGSCSVGSAAELAALHVYAGVGLGAHALVFPRPGPAEARAPGAGPVADPATDADDLAATQALGDGAALAERMRAAVAALGARPLGETAGVDDVEARAVGSRAALPFAPGAAPSPVPPAPGPEPVAPALGETAGVGADGALAAQIRAAFAVPFAPRPLTPSPAPAGPPVDLGATAGVAGVDLGSLVRAALPFAAAPATGDAPAPKEDRASAPPPEAPRPRRRSAALEATSGLDASEELAAQIRAALANPFADEPEAPEPLARDATAPPPVARERVPRGVRSLPACHAEGAHELDGLGAAFLAALTRVSASG